MNLQTPAVNFDALHNAVNDVNATMYPESMSVQFDGDPKKTVNFEPGQEQDAIYLAVRAWLSGTNTILLNRERLNSEYYWETIGQIKFTNKKV